MQSIISLIALVFVVIWATRIEIYTRKTSDALERVVKLLEKQKEEK